MSATARQQPRNYGWKKNIIEKKQIRGYLNEDRLLNRLMELFPGVRCKDDFALDTEPADGWVFLAPASVDQSEYMYGDWHLEGQPTGEGGGL